MRYLLPLCYIFLLNFALVISDGTFTNPILPSGPDPWVLKNNNFYYYMNTMGDRLSLWKTSEMSELNSVSPVTIWMPPSTGPYSGQIWAPEIHFYDEKFYVYFTADDGNNNNHRIYVLENASPDPTFGTWNFMGMARSRFLIFRESK